MSIIPGNGAPGRTLCGAAVADLSPSMVTVQEPVPLQAPLQPANVDSVSAVAVSVTRVPSAYVAEHVGPQLIVPGELVTVPVPVPVRLTLKVLSDDVKVAVMLRFEFSVTLQVFPEKESQPLQLVKLELTSALAVKVTIVVSG